MSKKRIVIVGGGFGGVKCARTLSKKLGTDQAEIVLFDRHNHLVFSPLLAEVVGSSINSLDVVVPLRQMLPKVFCRTEPVRSIDLKEKSVEFEGEDGQCARLSFNHLVIACGSATNLNVVPGMADHAFPLKTVADAANLRAHLITQMEQAEVSSDPARRKWHLTVLVVGGGYSGVEAAGEINDLFKDSARYFTHWGKQDVKVILIHSRSQILPEISSGLRDFALKKMQKAGVEFILDARANSATPEGVKLEDGRFIRGGTIVCTIGNGTAPVVAGLNAEKSKERLLTEPDMRVKGCQETWAIGDCALIVNSHDGQPAPTTGQFAEREGRQCAENIISALEGKPTRPFAFKALGELCSIGGHNAVADLFGMHLSGFLAWFIWRGVYLFKLPTVGRRLQVGFDWASLLVFPRDLAYVQTEQTQRVSHAHYDAGEFIFRRGEEPNNFYVLESGEVEVLRHVGQNGEAPKTAMAGTAGGPGPATPKNGADGQVVAVLGAGSFFGERALINNKPRAMSVRARTQANVLVMGKNVFTQISGALTPLRDALAQTLNRRAVDLSKNRPELYGLLQGTPVRSLMEPVPQPLLKPTATLREVGHAFIEHPNEFFYVSSDGQSLEGIITITDLIRARGNPDVADPLAKDFMTRNPVTISAEDDCAVAANAIREYRLKTLPVVEAKGSRRLAGCLRVRRLMAFVLKETEAGSTKASGTSAASK